jgi:hypothetical protein
MFRKDDQRCDKPLYLRLYDVDGGGPECRTNYKCVALARLSSEIRDDLMLASLEPPLVTPDQGEQMRTVVLASRLSGYTLFPPQPCPVHVYVCQLTDAGLISDDKVPSSALSLKYWALVDYHPIADGAV